MNRISCIYRIRNLTDNKCYIGSSCNFLSRKRGHIESLRSKRHHSILLQRAWNKYGESNFVFDIILYSDPKDNLHNEQLVLNTYSPEYNIAPIAGSPYPGFISEEHKTKLRNAKLGRKLSLSHRINIGKGNIGRIVSEETKAKMRSSGTGRKHSTEAKKKISLAQLGKLKGPRSEETKLKISKAHIGKKLTTQHKQKLRNIKLGKKLDQEHRDKISKALLGKPKKPGHCKGESNPSAKLNWNQVSDIRVRLTNKESLHSIARLYSVSVPTIARIRDKKVWK